MSIVGQLIHFSNLLARYEDDYAQIEELNEILMTLYRHMWLLDRTGITRTPECWQLVRIPNEPVNVLMVRGLLIGLANRIATVMNWQPHDESE